MVVGQPMRLFGKDEGQYINVDIIGDLATAKARHRGYTIVDRISSKNEREGTTGLKPEFV